MIHIYDGNNFVRRKIENDSTGEVPRTIFHSMINPQCLTFFVWDSQDGNKSRQDIFPDYKAKRPPLREDIYVAFDLVSESLKHTRVIQLRLPGYEADDIIAALTRHYAGKGEQVHIFSNDRDFLQLSAEFPDLVTSEAALKSGVMLSDIRYHKTLVGDTSDCIPGIPRFGEKAWEKAEKTEIKKWLDDVVACVNPGEFVWGSNSSNEWANDPQNQGLLAKYWKIIGFLPISQETLAEHIWVGDGDINKGDSYLKGFMQ